MRVEEMTSPGFAEAARGDAVALVPWGIVEEHGPHLPLGTDTLTAEALCSDVAARTGALVMPTVAYGNCVSTRNFPGSISIRFDTVRDLALDIVLELRRSGVHRIALVSGHAGGGHMRAMKLAAEEAVQAHPELRVAVVTPWDWARAFAREAPASVEGVPEWDGHAGAMETSLAMHLAPGLVRGGATAHRAEFPDPMIVADPERYFPSGVLGDPTKADAARGKAMHGFFVGKLVEVVELLRR